MRRILIATLVASVAPPTLAQTPGRFAWQTVEDRIKPAMQATALGPDFAGDSVDYKTGALSFSATDVSIPGNNSLEVAFSRSYAVRNRKDTATDEMLADWSVDLPSISGIFTTDWIAPGGSPGSRCTNTSLPPLPPNGYLYSDYWQGLDISFPGGGSDDLQAAMAGILTPSSGGPYPWVAENGTVRISCLPTIKNGTGEGFLAVMPDGTKVWYDWMSQYFETSMKGNQVNITGGTPMYWIQARRRNVLYATRVEDRFGNYVTYTYTNAWNAPGRLSSIQASDGRQITVGYAGNRVSSVSDGTRTWSYAYVTTSSGRVSLSSVTLPDASAWQINFSGFTNAEIKYHEAAFDEPLRSCTLIEMPINLSEAFAGSITHPAGAVASYSLNIQEHGRSNVPVDCSRVTTTPSGAPLGSGNNTNDDLNAATISANTLTLTQKQVAGAGIPTGTWNYSYVPGISVHRYPGTTRNYPVCTLGAIACAAPPCTNDACAGSSKTVVTGPGNTWVRYTHGNSYGYNEGLLLKVEEGSSESNILKTTTYQYDLSLGATTKPYPFVYGGSRKMNGDGFQQAAQRPMERREILQQGTKFVYQVDGFDYFANPVQATKSSQPSP